LAIFAVGQIVEGNLITPKLIGKKVGLHPMWIIFGLFAGGAVMGFVGVLIAVPITSIIGVLVRFTLEDYRKHFADETIK
jgi:predicted PurR-regulated permease PerM